MLFSEFAQQNPLFQITPLGAGITLIRDVMDVGMYLVEGTQKAALLDTGIGIGKLAPVVAGLTSLPVEVYLTHGHVDHGGGVSGFDRVFVPDGDGELLDWQRKPVLRRDFAAAFNHQLLEVSDLLEHMPAGKVDVKICRPGDKIELGERCLTILNLSGHTKGSVGYYDSQTETLFAGDGCNNSTFLFLRESTTLFQYRETLRSLNENWMKKIQRILICHAPHTSVPLSLVDDLLDCCDSVLERRASGEPFAFLYTPFQSGPARWAAPGEDHRWDHDGKFGNLIYAENRLS